MGNREIPDELVDQLLGEYEGPEQLTGPDGLINQLRKRLIERAAGAELAEHLGYPPGGEAPEGQANRRNGTTSKTLRTVDGPLSVELPRDRDASFEPRIVPKSLRPFALAPAWTPEVAPPAVGFPVFRFIADRAPRCRSGAEP